MKLHHRLMRSAIGAAMSSEWIVKAASRGRTHCVEAGLDPQIAAALEYQRIRALPPLHSMEPVVARAFAETNLGMAELPLEPMAEIVDATVGDPRIPVRMFVPPDAGPNWIVWLHGGGGVIGSIDGAEPVTRYLAARTRCTVASVGYRLGPEDKHPAAVDDACSAWEALAARARTGRIAVGGDSFGGFLAAHVDRYTRDSGVRRPDLQVLIYPVLDLSSSSPSIDRFAEGYLLTKAMMQYFHGHYLSAEDDRTACSPHFWDDVSGATPAIVVTAGFDPLVDEGNAWAARLREAGVNLRHRRHDSLVHGFLSLAGVVTAARGAFDHVCEEIVDMLSK